jgi:hypothetical protein
MDITSIKVSKELRDRLKDMGKKGETYEDIIWRLIGATETETEAKKDD